MGLKAQTVTNSQTIKEAIYLIILFLLMINLAIVCLYRLEASEVHNWDEARHGVNAYEMMVNNNYLVSTYNYQTDYYNYKPPLSMWLIMLDYTIFGYNTFALRIGSAICTLLMALMLALFLRKEFGKGAALLFMLFFSFNNEMLFFHMARSGDADAVYMLFICAGIIGLYYAFPRPAMGRSAGIGYFTIFLVGLCFAMAFMAKTLHAVLLLIIGLVYILLKCRSTLKQWSLILLSGLAGCFPIVIWAICRYRFDRFKFIGGMFWKEVGGRLVGEKKDYLSYLVYYLTDEAVLFMLGFVLVALLSIGLVKRAKSRHSIGTDVESDVNNEKGIKGITHKLSLFVIGFIVPLIVYSISGKLMEWYGYAGLIALTVLFSIVGARLLSCLTRRLSGRLLPVGMVIIFLLAGTGYFWSVNYERLEITHPPDFRLALQATVYRYPDYAGATIYIEKDNNEYRPADEWEQKYLLEA
ncbi:MAG: glycosyltransferase family 39 protein, partial [Lachnospiraceae bacterium]|nr:glycosyltransferase family 39 protein [Lachnospiraceae bacterium]